jgi:hypothetical protein
LTRKEGTGPFFDKWTCPVFFDRLNDSEATRILLALDFRLKVPLPNKSNSKDAPAEQSQPFDSLLDGRLPLLVGDIRVPIFRRKDEVHDGQTQDSPNGQPRPFDPFADP